MAQIEEHAGGEQPLFLHVPFTLPHTPPLAAPEFVVSGRSRYQNALAGIDAHAGRVIDAVDAAGITGNPIAVFTSDKGPEPLKGLGADLGGRSESGLCRGELPSAWKGANRVPAIIRWPGRTAPSRVNNELVSILDFGRTFANVAGVIFYFENPDTDYTTATEFHLDWLAGRYFAPTVAVALNGYWYKQLTDDGSIPPLVDERFHGRGISIGPAVLKRVNLAGRDVTFIGKWLHDVESRNRFDGGGDAAGGGDVARETLTNPCGREGIFGDKLRSPRGAKKPLLVPRYPMTPRQSQPAGSGARRSSPEAIIIHGERLLRRPGTFQLAQGSRPEPDVDHGAVHQNATVCSVRPCLREVARPISGRGLTRLIID